MPIHFSIGTADLNVCLVLAVTKLRAGRVALPLIRQLGSMCSDFDPWRLL